MSNVIKYTTYSSLEEKKLIEFTNWKIPETIQLNEDDSEETSEVMTDHLNQDFNKLISGEKEILDKAKLEAQSILQNVQVEMEHYREEQIRAIEQLRLQELEKAQMEGYAKGYQEGLEMGKESGNAAYQETINQAQKIIKESELERKQLIRDSEPILIELSILIAKKIILRELQQDKPLIVELVKETLKQSSELKEITICVHPNDFEMVKAGQKELLAFISGQANLIILPDYSIQSSGCIIRTSFGSLDARVDTQLEEIKRVLLDAIKGSVALEYGATV